MGRLLLGVCCKFFCLFNLRLREDPTHPLAPDKPREHSLLSSKKLKCDKMKWNWDKWRKKTSIQVEISDGRWRFSDTKAACFLLNRWWAYWYKCSLLVDSFSQNMASTKRLSLFLCWCWEISYCFHQFYNYLPKVYLFVGLIRWHWGE